MNTASAHVEHGDVLRPTSFLFRGVGEGASEHRAKVGAVFAERSTVLSFALGISTCKGFAAATKLGLEGTKELNRVPVHGMKGGTWNSVTRRKSRRRPPLCSAQYVEEAGLTRMGMPARPATERDKFLPKWLDPSCYPNHCPDLGIVLRKPVRRCSGFLRPKAMSASSR